MYAKDAEAAQQPTYSCMQFYQSKLQHAVKETACFFGSCPNCSRYIKRPFFDILSIFDKIIGSTVNFRVNTGLDEKGWKQQRKDLSQCFKWGVGSSGAFWISEARANTGASALLFQTPMSQH